MKFKAEPALHIIDNKTKTVLCKFDKNGFFETDDPKKIARLAPWFEQVIDEVPSELIKATTQRLPPKHRRM